MSQVDPSFQSPVAPADNTERTLAMLCHLLGLCGFVIPVPFVNVVGPLVLWLLKKDQYPFVDDQGKEAVNFQITIILAMLVCIPLAFVVIGIFLAVALAVANLVLIIIAAIKSNGGETYRYPFCLRLIK